MTCEEVFVVVAMVGPEEASQEQRIAMLEHLDACDNCKRGLLRAANDVSIEMSEAAGARYLTAMRLANQDAKAHKARHTH